MQVQKLGGLESNFLVEWKGWDEMDTLCPIFYEVTLKKGVFSSEVFEKFNGGDLFFDFNNNQIVLQNNNEEVIFNLHVTATPEWK